MEDRKMRERSENVESVKEFFKRKRDRTEEEERDEKRAFQGSKKTPRLPVKTTDEKVH